MDFYKEMLLHILENENISITFPGIDTNLSELLECECYQTLQKIKAVIKDDALDDPACFMRIEEIIRIFEDAGSDGGSRHDFG